MSSYLALEDAFRDIPSLQGVLVTAMPDCLLVDSYSVDNSWSAEEVASYLGDLTRMNQGVLKSLKKWSSSSQITIENDDVRVVLHEYQDDFVIGFIFDVNISMGMIRLLVKQALLELTPRLKPLLETSQEGKGSAAVKLLDYLKKYAPDPHASIMRISLKTGIPMDLLDAPSQLAPEQVARIETAVCDILGIESLDL